VERIVLFAQSNIGAEDGDCPVDPGAEESIVSLVGAAFRSMVDPERAAAYRAAGWWGDQTVADLVARHAVERPHEPAVITTEHRLSWADYHQLSDRLGLCLVESGIEPGQRVAVLLPDGASAHVAFLANEKTGAVTVGIGARAGQGEIRHLLVHTGSVALITHAHHRGTDMAELCRQLRAEGVPLQVHVVIPVFEADATGPILVNGEESPRRKDAPDGFFDGRRLGPDDLFIINSTSGTTGMPKCVMHTQNSKFYMAQQACEVAQLGPGEVLVGMAPIPFGFGLFTTHFLTAVLGAPAVVTDRFTAETTLELIEREQGTVLVCVSTQFKMMLQSPEMATRDLASLRVMFTGGEMIPYEAAREFEKRTGAFVLNFYGSNESGVATGTRVTDSEEVRLRTGGGSLSGTEVRLFDDGVDVTATGRGQPGSRGPALCLGYDNDPDATAELFTPDGFALHADIVTIDERGYLSVVGRKSEIIIRGGKNLSAAVVEDAVSAHPLVGLAAAVPMPDQIFGERVCVYVELRSGGTLSLAELTGFLGEQGTSKEYYPEHLVVLDQLPRSSGGKVAKGQLAAQARSLASAQGEHPAPAEGEHQEQEPASDESPHDQRGAEHAVD
jgi:acyl-CoA synthetase